MKLSLGDGSINIDLWQISHIFFLREGKFRLDVIARITVTDSLLMQYQLRYGYKKLSGNY